MVDFLDEAMPAVAGCPIHDSPFDPICSECKRKLADMGDGLPLDYIPLEKRLIEKLATSDVSTADLIGEVDPIKVAQGRTLDDASTVHFGLLPRAHRSIFAVNELPDLAEVRKVTAQGVNIETFMLDNNPVLVEFTRELTRINGGRAVMCLPGELGKLVLIEEIRRRSR